MTADDFSFMIRTVIMMMEAMSMKMRRTTTRSATDISTLSALTPQGSVASSKASWKTLVMTLFINCLYLFVMVENEFLSFYIIQDSFDPFCLVPIDFVSYLHHPGYWLSLRQNLRKVSRSQYIPIVNFKLFDFVIYYCWVCELLYFIYMPSRIFHQKYCLQRNSVLIPWKNFNYIHNS